MLTCYLFLLIFVGMKNVSKLNDGDLMLASEVAHELGVESVTIRRWADEGMLEHVKTGRGVRIFSRTDVERLKKARESR